MFATDRPEAVLSEKQKYRLKFATYEHNGRLFCWTCRTYELKSFNAYQLLKKHYQRHHRPQYRLCQFVRSDDIQTVLDALQSSLGTIVRRSAASEEMASIGVHVRLAAAHRLVDLRRLRTVANFLSIHRDENNHPLDEINELKNSILDEMTRQYQEEKEREEREEQIRERNEQNYEERKKFEKVEKRLKKFAADILARSQYYANANRTTEEESDDEEEDTL